MTNEADASQVMIRAEDVSKRFRTGRNELLVLEQFALDVHRGEVVSLLGASGCGKSTILKMLAGFFPPSEGRLLLDGEEIKGLEPRCGMVFQSYALFPWLSVLDNVGFGPRMAGVPKTRRREVADRFIQMVGLTGFENAYPGQLSGGMQQRVALCRALANQPDILLCDEPFAALDAMTRQIMQEELLRIVQASGQTVLFVTHSIDEALIISDRIVVMSARPGRVKSIYENAIPRPRKLDVQLTVNYLGLKRRIWDDVEQEVRGIISHESSILDVNATSSQPN